MLRPLVLAIPILTLPLVAHDAKWPDPDRNYRPLVRWWWPSDLPENLPPGPELEMIAAAGFGGVEILPARALDEGANQSLKWLSAPWIKRYSNASNLASPLGLQLDLSCNGPTPGNLPPISPHESAIKSVPITHSTNGGPVELKLPQGGIDCLGAWPSHGAPVDLMPFVDTESFQLTWDPPPGKWNIYGIGRDPTDFPDHFSTTTASNSLSGFSKAFLESDSPPPRAYSIGFTELDADWSSVLVPGFKRRRGYDLREQLPALFGDAEAGTAERVLCDYRETLADLQRDSLVIFHHWAHKHASLSRIQLEGVAGNPLDLHGIPDIPGQIFKGLPNDPDLPLLSFAASAAHLQAKPLIAATAFSSPDDPHQVSPAEMKETIDMFWLGGANQLVLDGILSGEPDELIPPRKLPPMTPLGPGSGRFENIASFNAYISRCQSILQSGAPDHEVLLYYPTHDHFVKRGGVPLKPEEQLGWFMPTMFYRAAQTLIDHGIPCDYVSDLLLLDATVTDGDILLGGLTYRTLVLPNVRQLPERTARQILELTRRGATITILGDWPRDVPGFPSPDIRRGTLFNTLEDIPDSQVLEGSDLIRMLNELSIIPEPMADFGLRFVRRSHEEGRHYFIVNRSDRKVDDWVPLASPATSAVLMDPRFLRRSGIASSRIQNGKFEVRLSLDPGETRILRTFDTKQAQGPMWSEFIPFANPLQIGGTWQVEFTQGAPELPDSFTTPLLGSWTSLTDPRVSRFSGTARYTTSFEVPSEGHWLLDLGEVAHSARVFINDNDAGSVFAPPHHFDVSRLLRVGENMLTVEVSNLPQPPPDSNQAPKSSGLLGPVRLIPIQQ